MTARIWPIAAILCAWSAAPASAQSDQRQFPEHNFSGRFLYSANSGQRSYGLDNSPGYSIGYLLRTNRWLAFDVALEVVPHALDSTSLGGSQGLATPAPRNNAFFIPMGLRAVWQPKNRFRATLGGGAAYFQHNFNNPGPGLSYGNSSSWGTQVVGSADCALTESGVLRVGVTARVYNIPGLPQDQTARVWTIGPEFTFSFH